MGVHRVDTGGSKPTPIGTEITQVCREQAEHVAARAAEVLDGTVPAWEFAAESGDAAHELERLANDRRAVVIITGRSRFPARHVLGSVPARLVRHARRPITVTRKPSGGHSRRGMR